MTELLNRNLLAVRTQDRNEFLERAKATEGCVLLTASEPDFGISDGVRIHLTKSIQHGKTHYVSAEGDYYVRKAIVDYETRVTGAVYSTDQVIVTAGATEGLYAAFQSILNPGDEVIVPLPAIGLYESNIRLAGAVPVFLDTTEDGFQINPETLKALVTDKTKAILINSPNNPTGVVYTHQSLQAVADAVKGKPIFVISDDTYCHVYFAAATAPSFVMEFPEIKAQTLVVKSLSNSNALSGFRIGYLFGPQEIIRHIKVLHGAMLTSMVSLFQDPIVETCHTGITGMIEAYKSRGEYVYQRLDSMGLPYTRADGTFYILVDIKKFGMTSQEFAGRLLEEAKVAVMPSSFYGVEGYIRLSTAAPLSRLKMGMGRLEAFVQGL